MKILKKKVLLKSAIITVAVFFPISCIQSTSNQGGGAAAPANTPVTANSGWVSCNGSSTGTASAGAIDGTKTFIQDQNNNQVSLCSAISSRGKKVGVFQFFGISCATCPAEAKQVQTFLAQDPNAQYIAQFIVFTDPPASRSQDGINSFLSQSVAPSAPAPNVMFDLNSTVFNQISSLSGGSSTPLFGTAIALNILGHPIMISAGSQTQTLISQLDALTQEVGN